MKTPRKTTPAAPKTRTSLEVRSNLKAINQGDLRVGPNQVPATKRRVLWAADAVAHQPKISDGNTSARSTRYRRGSSKAACVRTADSSRSRAAEVKSTIHGIHGEPHHSVGLARRSLQVQPARHWASLIVHPGRWRFSKSNSSRDSSRRTASTRAIPMKRLSAYTHSLPMRERNMDWGNGGVPIDSILCGEHGSAGGLNAGAKRQLRMCEITLEFRLALERASIGGSTQARCGTCAAELNQGSLGARVKDF